MDWKDLGKAVKKYAPVLGTALGGPAGGAVGGVVTMVASAFGVEEEPEAIMKAIETDPIAAIKLKEIENNTKVELQRLIVEAEGQQLAADTQRILSVNQTIQAEAQSEHWAQWFWRPLWGMISAAAFMVVCSFVCVLAYRAITQNDSQAHRNDPHNYWDIHHVVWYTGCDPGYQRVGEE